MTASKFGRVLVTGLLAATVAGGSAGPAAAQSDCPSPVNPAVPTTDQQRAVLRRCTYDALAQATAFQAGTAGTVASVEQQVTGYEKHLATVDGVANLALTHATDLRDKTQDVIRVKNKFDLDKSIKFNSQRFKLRNGIPFGRAIVGILQKLGLSG